MLTFQSMVEKKAWRLISSTPSGPAPIDTDHYGSVNLARLFLLFSEDQRVHTFFSQWFSACDSCGCQNVNKLKLSEGCNVRLNTLHCLLF